VPPKPPRARAAASIESAADAAAAASVTPDWAISGARAEQRAACAAQASEREQEQLRSRAQPTLLRRRASHLTGRSAVHAPSSERTVPPKPLRAGAAATIESAADAAAAASVTPDWAISGARAEQRAACAAQASEREQEQLRSRAWPTLLRRRASHPTGRSAVHAPSSERPVPLKPPKESKSNFSIESVAVAAAAASVTPDWAISGARAEQRAACAAQASEREQEQLRSRA